MFLSSNLVCSYRSLLSQFGRVDVDVVAFGLTMFGGKFVAWQVKDGPKREQPEVETAKVLQVFNHLPTRSVGTAKPPGLRLQVARISRPSNKWDSGKFQSYSLARLLVSFI